MLRKVLGIFVKIIVGVFAFYFFITLVLVPTVLPWVAQSQASKILGVPVRVASIQFNPFLWRLSVYGLEIRGKDQAILAGFDRFRVNVSFLGLFKKEYRVESVELDGLRVNAALLPDGTIDLMALVSASGDAAVPAATASAKNEAPASEAEGTVVTDQGNASSSAEVALPVVYVDDILLRKGQIRFTDKSVTPSFAAVVAPINLHVTGFSTKPDAEVHVVFDTGLGEKGKIASEGLVRPFVQPLWLETSLTINNYALDVLSPYTGKYTGRALKDGELEFRIDYRIADNKLTAGHKLLIQRFEFGDKVQSKDALPLPFGLAVALLEDPQGRIKISLPVTGDMSKPDFKYWPLLGQVARNFFMKIVTKPFAFLGSMLGTEDGAEELGYVKFTPGQSDLASGEQEKIQTLVKGLNERPKLSLEVKGSYDPEMDWKAIKTASLAAEYKELRANSSKSDLDVYEMIYQRRFGLQSLWGVTKKYKKKAGEYDAALLEELKRQLIENAPPDKPALEALASARAKVVYDFMLASGFAPDRLKLGGNHEVQGAMGFVPLEFVLTVFGETPEAVAAPEASGAETSSVSSTGTTVQE